MRTRIPVSVRVKPVTVVRIEALAKVWEVSKTAAVERAIHGAAKREKVKE